MTGGEQKQLEVGRALLLRPKVLLIDDPSLGRSPLVVADVFTLLRQLANQGTTVLMVEQNLKSALKMADEAFALESGRQVLHKRADELLDDPNIEWLFLGGSTQTALEDLDMLDPDEIFLVQLAEFMCMLMPLDRLGYRSDYSFEVFKDDCQRMPLATVAERAGRSAG